MPVNTVGPCRVALKSGLAAVLVVCAAAAPAVAAAPHAKAARHAQRRRVTHHHAAHRKTPRVASVSSGARAPKGAAGASSILSTAGVCPASGLVPSPGNMATVSAATLCLINQQRAAAGVAPLRASPALGTAAAAHSADMVALDYFDHVSPSGEAPIDRVTAAGYGGPGGAISVGENIAAVADPATPEAVVTMWMDSPDHRANILDPGYVDSGIGVAPELPAGLGSGPGATYTQDFGATG